MIPPNETQTHRHRGRSSSSSANFLAFLSSRRKKGTKKQHTIFSAEKKEKSPTDDDSPREKFQNSFRESASLDKSFRVAINTPAAIYAPWDRPKSDLD